MSDKSKARKRKHKRKHSGGMEIALSSEDLAIQASCRILEMRSTAGFRETPKIEAPYRQVSTNRIIQYDQPWILEFSWQVLGPLACLLDCGYWKTTVLFETIGGDETHYSPEEDTQDVGIPGHQYQCNIQIKPYALKPGVYRVVACLQYYLENGKPGPIAGFEDMGLIKIFEDKRMGKPDNENGQPEVEAVEYTH